MMPVGPRQPIVTALTDQNTVLRKDTDQFLGKEGVPAALLGYVVDHPVQCRSVSNKIADELPGLGPVQFPERQFTVIRPEGPPGAPFWSVSQDHDNFSTVHRLHDRIDEVLAGVIKPVQVLENDDCGSPPDGPDNATNMFTQACMAGF